MMRNTWIVWTNSPACHESEALRGLQWRIPLAADSDAFDTLQATASEARASRKYAIHYTKQSHELSHPWVITPLSWGAGVLCACSRSEVVQAGAIIFYQIRVTFWMPACYICETFHLPVPFFSLPLFHRYPMQCSSLHFQTRYKPKTELPNSGRIKPKTQKKQLWQSFTFPLRLNGTSREKRSLCLSPRSRFGGGYHAGCMLNKSTQV